MVLEWRDRERARGSRCNSGKICGDPTALKICVLYKFWALKGMRAQVRFLQMIVEFWDLDTKAFNLDGKPLRIEVEDIYFITKLSFQGEVVNLKVMGAGGGMNIEDYISTHCVASTKKVGCQLPVRAIENMILMIVVLVLTQITRSTSLHQASRELMFYTMEFL
jgi:hypothetical protein